MRPSLSSSCQTCSSHSGLREHCRPVCPVCLSSSMKKCQIVSAVYVPGPCAHTCGLYQRAFVSLPVERNISKWKPCLACDAERAMSNWHAVFVVCLHCLHKAGKHRRLPPYMDTKHKGCTCEDMLKQTPDSGYPHLNGR